MFANADIINKEPTVGKLISKFLTKREIEHLLDPEIPPWNKLVFIFSTGGKIGEIFSLEKNRINWSERSVFVKGKRD